MNISRHFILTIAIVALCISQAPAFDPANGDLSREDADDIRVLTFNVFNAFVSNAALTSGEYTRLLQAIDPDIIAMEEVTTSVSQASLESELQAILGGTWTAHLGTGLRGDRNVLATRYSLSMLTTDTIPATNLRGVTAGLVDLPVGTYGSDFYVMAVHLKSAQGTSESQQRQESADGIINWMRDARTPGENIDLPTNTPMLILGDTNLNFDDRGEAQPYHADQTLVNGNIFNEGTYGSDSPPDWDGTDNADADPYDYTNADVHTFLGSGSRYDRMIYTDSVIHAANRFILNTATMTTGALASAGLVATDTALASDHLPVVVDFRLGANPASPGQLLINEFVYDDAGTDDANFIEFINIGGQEVVLDAPVDYHFLQSDSNLPTTAPPVTVENQADTYDLHGVIPPGGVFVLYDSAGQSSAIASTIETALSALQRQDIAGFGLTNSTNVAVALVTKTPFDDTVAAFDAALIDAYMYADTASSEDHYFRTNSGNSLLITLGADQRSTRWASGETRADDSFSRKVGDTTANSFLGWVIFDLATPGTPNNTLVPVELSAFIAY